LVTADGIKSDPAKVEAIMKMPTPKDVSELRSFLGMVTYFSRFIQGFAEIALVLHALTKKGTPFVWTAEHQSAFERLKESLTKTPVLRPFDPTHEIVVQTDASDRAIGAVLLQRPPSGALRPVAYLSRKLSPAEGNYSVQEKEAAAVVHAFKKWEHYLMGIEFTLETDHQSFIHLKESKNPSPRLLRWLDFLALFHYKPHYIAGKTNHTADCLSRLVPDLSVISGPVADGEVIAKIKSGYADDPYFSPVFRSLILGEKVEAKFKSRLVHFYATDGVLFFRDASGDRTCIPKIAELKLQLLRECHESATAGHLGVENTYVLLARRFFWPKMGTQVRTWVRGCIACQKTKPDLRGTVGLFKPLELPTAPWESIGMDFITALPPAQGYDSIMTVIDRHTKMAHFIPTQKDVTAQGVAELFAGQIFRLHGLPKSIVSDRDSKFTSEFWKALFKRLDVKLSMSTADHPQSNGQTERANGAIIQMLRSFCYEKPDSWIGQLPLLEFAYNSARSSSSERSPFVVAYGLQPLAPADIYSPVPPTADPGDLVNRIKGIHQWVRDNLVQASDEQAVRANETRREAKFKQGDMVLLDAEHARSSTAVSDNNKMKEVFSGPFKILQVGEGYVELDLPPRMRIHRRVNVNKIKEYHPPVIPHEEPAPEEDGSYEVESLIKKKRIVRGRKYVLQYLVRWKGYGPENDEWIDRSELQRNATEILMEFEKAQGAFSLRRGGRVSPV
jgi:hypothetical protein